MPTVLDLAALPKCPLCQGELQFVRLGTIGGARRYAELVELTCLEHGTVYLTREGLTGEGPDNGSALEDPGNDAL